MNIITRNLIAIALSISSVAASDAADSSPPTSPRAEHEADLTLAQSKVAQATGRPQNRARRVESVFPGEDALALLGERLEQTDRADVTWAVGRIFERLQLPAERRGAYSYISSAKLQKASDYVEFNELSDTVLLAAKSVRVAFARNVTIISNGRVDISHGAGLVVIAAGDIRISGESEHLAAGDISGVYITKGEFELSRGSKPIVYAVRGAKTGGSFPIAYNTDLKLGSGYTATSFTRGSLFRDEPIRTPSPPSMTVNSGESMPFTGQRCDRGADAVALFDGLLPSVRRQSDCPRIDSAAVRCEESSGSGVTARWKERWSFGVCGRSVDYIVDKAPNVMSINPAIRTQGLGAQSLAAPARDYSPPGGDLGKRRAKLFEEGSGHLQKRDLLEARAKYQEAFDLTGDDPYALSNLASVDKQIAAVDAKVAKHTAVIGSGRATARDFANRGLAYITAYDAGRGLKDLKQAVDMNNADPGLQTDLALGYLHSDRMSEAHGVAHQVTSRLPRYVKAYEISAWAQLLSNSHEAAYKAAFSSLVEAPGWTAERFASEKAGYRVLAGYFALRGCRNRAKANEWVRQWSAFTSKAAWPDVLALHLIGELDEADVTEVAEKLKQADQGRALADQRVFLAMEELYAATGDRQRKAMIQFFQTPVYAAGMELQYAIRMRLLAPGQALRGRSASEPECFR